MPTFELEIACPNCFERGLAKVEEAREGRWKRLRIEETPVGFRLLLQSSQHAEAKFQCLQCGANFFL